MQTVIILIHLMVVMVMIGLVLLQKSEGGGLGMGSGGGFMSSRGTANVLTRATAILAAIFFSTSLLLSIVASIDRKPTSILQGGGATAPGSSLPGSAPGGVFDQLNAPAAPATPAAPAAPEAPKSQ